MKYRVSSFEDVETGVYTYVVQKKWLVFWEDVYYAADKRDAYKHRRRLVDEEK